VSPLLRSELRLRLGPQRCDGGIWRAGLRPLCSVRASAIGGDSEAVERVLADLVAAGHALPARASICIEDEYLFHATFAADRSPREVSAAATEYFAETLGADNLLVQTSLAASGRTWVAVAIDADLVERLHGVLNDREIDLLHLRSSLLEDLAALGDSLALDDGVAVLLRREGVSMVGLQRGSIADIAWERCDIDMPAALEHRVRGYRARFSALLNPTQSPPPKLPVVMVPLDARQHALVGPLVAARGWRLLDPLLGAES
jgi:hypothetical protein